MAVEVARLRLLFEAAFKRGQSFPLVNVCNHVQVTLHSCNVMLSSLVVKAAQNVVFHQHQRPHSLTFMHDAEGLQAWDHRFFAVSLLGRDPHGQ